MAYNQYQGQQAQNPYEQYQGNPYQEAGAAENAYGGQVCRFSGEKDDTGVDSIGQCRGVALRDLRQLVVVCVYFA